MPGPGKPGPAPEVLFEDEAVLAVAKPAGVEVIQGRGPRPPGAPRPLRAQVEALLGARVFVVHRLDAEASGVVVFAKDAATHRLLSMQFESRKARKTYLAAVLGTMPGQGAMDWPIRECGSGRMAVAAGGKPSLTRWRSLRLFKGAALLEVHPVTGRRHQIRAHLYHAGHPVLGDMRYGTQRPVGGAGRLMLHGLELAFESHRARRLRIRCEPPAEFQAALDSLQAGEHA